MGENNQILKGRLPSTPLGLEVSRFRPDNEGTVAFNNLLYPSCHRSVPTRQRGDGDHLLILFQHLDNPRSDPTTRGRRIVLLLLQIPRPEGGSDPTLRGRRLERDGTDLPFLQSSDPTTRGRRHDRNLRTLLDTPVPTRQRGDGDGEKDRCKKRLARFRPDNEGTAMVNVMERPALRSCSDPTTRGRRSRAKHQISRHWLRFRPDNEGTATGLRCSPLSRAILFRPDNEGTAKDFPHPGLEHTTMVPTRQRGDGDRKKDEGRPFCVGVPTRQRGDGDFSIALFRTDSVGKQFGSDGRVRRCGGFQAKGLLRLMLPLHPCTPTRLHACTLRR